MEVVASGVDAFKMKNAPQVCCHTTRLRGILLSAKINTFLNILHNILDYFHICSSAQYSGNPIADVFTISWYSSIRLRMRCLNVDVGFETCSM